MTSSGARTSWATSTSPSCSFPRSLRAHAAPGAPESDALVPFHKLTGWMTYSLVEPIQKVMGWAFEGVEHMTGLPEYRNGACTSVRAPEAQG